MAKKLSKSKNILKLLPLFLIAVILVFSVVFTVILVPILTVSTNIGFDLIFIMLLVITATVSSAVALIFYMILKGERIL